MDTQHTALYFSDVRARRRTVGKKGALVQMQSPKTKPNDLLHGADNSYDWDRYWDCYIREEYVHNSARVGKAGVVRKESDPRPSPPEQWILSKMTHDERRTLNELRRPPDAQIATDHGRVERIKKDIRVLTLRLSNQEFCKRAPKLVVDKAREQLLQLHDKLKIVLTRLKQLQRVYNLSYGASPARSSCAVCIK